MWKRFSLVFFLLIILAACSQGTSTPENDKGAAPTPEIQETSPGAQPASPTDSSAATSQGLPLPTDRVALFSASGACAVCHTNMVDQAGTDVSIDSLWRSTMLANAARDPYWLATIRSEVEQAPQHNAVIQKKCATCHMPMAEVTLASEEQEVLVLDQGLQDPANPLHNLAMDSVSCTLCHQIEADNLGQPESFSGGFLIDTTLPEGERMAYGPYLTDANMVTLMQASSGFIPQQSTHLAQSEVCGACHDLYTPYLDSAGEIAGEFAEQLIYSEWANSEYADTTSCQNCHMPEAQGSVQLSITGGPPRQPFYQHVFVGGNAYMLGMLKQNGEALQVTAATKHFDNTIAQTIDLLASKSAKLTLGQLRVENNMLLADVSTENLAGHKFPAGYPSRRAWLNVRLLDGAGNLIFESGTLSADGAITGNDNDADPTNYEPHYDLLTSSDQVQIYESIMVNSDGEVTTQLLRGARMIKDNRLLPAGFQPNPDVPEVDPQGEATQDTNFAAGGDTLSLQIDLSQEKGPFTLEVSLLYQSIAYRWAENLVQEAGAEIEQFDQMYANLPNLPLVADTQLAMVSP
jgi:hypothetical protein